LTQSGARTKIAGVVTETKSLSSGDAVRPFAVAALFLVCFAPAQDKPAAPKPPAAKPASAPPAGWMDLAVGTDVRYRMTGSNQCKMGGGSGSGGGEDSELRVVGLAAEQDGKLRLALIDETLPKDKIGVPIVRAMIARLDPATGELAPADGEAADPLVARYSPIGEFPFPPLSAVEWKGRKAVRKDAHVAICGEPQVLPLAFSFTTRKEGRTQVPVLVADLGSKQPVAIKLGSIGGMIDIAEGRMPKIGNVEPVDASVTALHREYSLDAAKGRVTEIRTTSAATAAGGRMTIEGSHTTTETARRQLTGDALTPFAAAVTEICAIANSKDDKGKRRERAAALQAGAAKLDLAATVERLVDSLTRDALPPGIPR
jgi:hypothetical protein